MTLAGYLQLGNTQYFVTNYMNQEIMESMSPVDWWSVAAIEEIGTENLEVIKILMSLPSSTASFERSFSTLKDIITDKRNRLGVDKASRLCTVHQSLNVWKPYGSKVRRTFL